MKNAKAFRLTSSGLVGADPVHQVLAPRSMQPEEPQKDGTTKLLMKLALTNGFNEAGEVRKEDGYVKQSNILELVGFALSKDACIKGLPEFVDLLRSAGISEDMVNNELVKQFLVMKKPIIHEKPSKPDQEQGKLEPTKPVEPYVEAHIKKVLPVKKARKKVLEDVRVNVSKRPAPYTKRRPLRRPVKSKYANWDAHDSDMEEA